MTHEPRTQEEIYQSYRNSLIGKIAKLNNFTQRSFNYVWAQAFSKEARDLELKTTIAELAGWIDYTGGPIDSDDLDTLGLSEVTTAGEINAIMDDQYLDEYVKIVGVSRLPGSRATGKVDLQTQSGQTDIPEGTRVTTAPEESGQTTDFLTTEVASTADGVTTVTGVGIQAVEVGDSFNIPAGKIIRMADPPIGLKGVNNPAATTGGENEESNEDLRARAKTAVESSSGGGTVDGIKGYIRQNVEAVGEGDVIIDEFTDTQPPKVDVIVDGGTDTDVSDAIEFSRPAGMRHDLVRPQVIQLGFDMNLRGVDIDTTNVENEIEEVLLDFGISEDFFEDDFIRTVMETDSNIINIDDIGGIIERVTNEAFTYKSGTTDYLLDYTYEDVNGSISVEDIDGNTYVQGSDFTVADQTNDGYPETIVWGGGGTPDDGDTFFVDYDVTDPQNTFDDDRYSTHLVRDETFTFNLGHTNQFEFNVNDPWYELSGVPFTASASISDSGGTAYTKDTDWQLVPLDGANEETVTYSTGTTNYQLSNELTVDEIAIIDDNGNIYERGVDYTLSDTDSDSYNDTIVWDDTATVPADGLDFKVNYNGYPKYVRWDDNASTPATGDMFTVTFDQRLYNVKYDIVETPDDEIRDNSGDTYNEGTEYTVGDYSRDGENDAIVWTTKPASLASGEEFYFSYLNEGDIFFGQREKADPGTINISSN